MQSSWLRRFGRIEGGGLLMGRLVRVVWLLGRLTSKNRTDGAILA